MCEENAEIFMKLETDVEERTKGDNRKEERGTR
jgi:hypothetical protein